MDKTQRQSLQTRTADTLWLLPSCDRSTRWKSAIQAGHGSYVGWDELLASKEFMEFEKECLAHIPEFAAAHFTKGPEILPGWRLRFNLTQGGNGYDLLLEDATDKKCGYAAITDERGVIRQSKAINCPIWAASAGPRGQTRRRTYPGFQIRRVASQKLPIRTRVKSASGRDSLRSGITFSRDVRRFNS